MDIKFKDFKVGDLVRTNFSYAGKGQIFVILHIGEITEYFHERIIQIKSLSEIKNHTNLIYESELEKI